MQSYPDMKTPPRFPDRSRAAGLLPGFQWGTVSRHPTTATGAAKFQGAVTTLTGPYIRNMPRSALFVLGPHRPARIVGLGGGRGIFSKLSPAALSDRSLP
jgi:hypothetical protein